MKRSPLLRRTPMLQRSPLLAGASRLAARALLRKPMKRTRRRAATPAERAYLDRVAALSCVACLMDGVDGTPAVIHHSRLRPDGTAYGAGVRAPHTEVAPLCPPHHRGGVKGVPGRHSDEAEFTARYGDDLHLLAYTAQRLSPKEAS